MARGAGSDPVEQAKGLWSWSARHPEWHPGDWGAEVVSWAARGEARTLLLADPQLPDADAEPQRRKAVMRLLDREAKRADHVTIAVTIGFHTRSSEELWERLRGASEVSIHGHRAVSKRLSKRAAKAFVEIELGTVLPGGVVPLRIGKPRRQETPFLIPSHSALLFGDAVVNSPEGVRAWSLEPISAKTKRFYRDSFNPTAEPLAELGAERLLFTHGPPVLRNGSKKLREGLAAGPWFRDRQTGGLVCGLA